MIGITGGSGFYKLPGLNIESTLTEVTPFGQPSSKISIGSLDGQRVAFMPRHGEKHGYLPHEINYRANIFALKKAGVRQLISISAVGSLREDLPPGSLALVDQYFDFTKGQRASTFFGNGLVAHVSTAQSACKNLQAFIKATAGQKGTKLFTDCVYACVEGPRLGTKAESNFFRQIKCDVVGMTNIPEAFLATEAQMSYATIAVVTDYDCWREDPASYVNVDAVFVTYKKSLEKVQSLIADILCADSSGFDLNAAPARLSLKHAMVSDIQALSTEQRSIYDVLSS